MTPGDNGASTPEDDDPFGYLYADGQARGAQPPSAGYSYPGSVNRRARPVGERTYGGQQQAQQQAQYGQTVPQQVAYGQQQPGYPQSNAHYQAPETLAGGGPGDRHPMPPSGGDDRRRGPNTKGLLIGAVAVVAAVVIGIGLAVLNGDDDKDKTGGQAGSTPAQSQKASTKPSPTSSVPDDAEVPEPIDAKALRLEGGATTASDVKGAQAAGGVYVTNLNQTGNGVTWTVDGIPAAGDYTLFARYSAVADGKMTLTVNGKTFGSKFSLKNYTGKKDPAEAWTTSYTYPSLNKGTNTFSLTCQDGDSCDVLLDQLWVKKGQVKN